MTTTFNKNKITEILEHDISWYVDNEEVQELSEVEIEHIEDSIKQGYTLGQIVMSFTNDKGEDEETTGWWHIINWKNIALEFYNADSPEKIAKARNKFDENWG